MKKIIILICIGILGYGAIKMIFGNNDVVTEKKAYVPTWGKIIYISPKKDYNGSTIKGFLEIPLDTSGRGQKFIRVRVGDHQQRDRICFLRVAYPEYKITIPISAISQKQDGVWVLDPNENIKKISLTKK